MKLSKVGEDLLGHPDAEVVAPAPDHRIHLVDQRDGGRAHMLAPEAFELPFDLLDGVRARFDQQLVATARAIGSRIMADVEPQEIEAFSQVTNMGFLV